MRLADEVEVGKTPEHGAHPLTEQVVIVDHQHAVGCDRLAHGVTVTVTVVPSVGEVSITSSAPIASARSRMICSPR